MGGASRSPLAAQKDLNYDSLIAAAEAGDQEILGLFHTMGQYLGIGIANVANTLNPSKIILAGHLACAAKFFWPATKESFGNRIFAGMDCDIKVSELQDNAEVMAGLSTFLYYSGLKDTSNGRNTN
jgi:predicted NBD/HSP70 family sugar kinase